MAFMVTGSECLECLSVVAALCYLVVICIDGLQFFSVSRRYVQDHSMKKRKPSHWWSTTAAPTVSHAHGHLVVLLHVPQHLLIALVVVVQVPR